MLVIMMVCIFIFGTPMNAKASIKMTMKTAALSTTNKKKMYKLCRQFRDYAGFQYAYKMKVGQKRNYNFNNKKVRKNALRYMIDPKSSYHLKKVQDKRSMNLFGKKTPSVKPLIGDWGEGTPEIGSFKIKKTNSTYTINANLYWVDTAYSYHKQKVGTLKYTVKKNKKSSYGFVVKKLVIKKLSELQ